MGAHFVAINTNNISHNCGAGINVMRFVQRLDCIPHSMKKTKVNAVSLIKNLILILFIFCGLFVGFRCRHVVGQVIFAMSIFNNKDFFDFICIYDWLNFDV